MVMKAETVLSPGWQHRDVLNMTPRREVRRETFPVTSARDRCSPSHRPAFPWAEPVGEVPPHPQPLPQIPPCLVCPLALRTSNDASICRAFSPCSCKHAGAVSGMFRVGPPLAVRRGRGRSFTVQTPPRRVLRERPASRSPPGRAGPPPGRVRKVLSEPVSALLFRSCQQPPTGHNSTDVTAPLWFAKPNTLSWCPTSGPSAPQQGPGSSAGPVPAQGFRGRSLPASLTCGLLPSLGSGSFWSCARPGVTRRWPLGGRQPEGQTGLRLTLTWGGDRVPVKRRSLKHEGL